MTARRLLPAAWILLLLADALRGGSTVVFRGGVRAPMDDFRLAGERMVVRRGERSVVVPRAQVASILFAELPEAGSGGAGGDDLRRRAAEHAPAGATPRGVEILLREDRWELHEDGSHVERHHRIMRIVDGRGLAQGERSFVHDPRESDLRLATARILTRDGRLLSATSRDVTHDMPWLGKGAATGWIRTRLSLPGLEPGGVCEWIWEIRHRRNVPWNPFRGSAAFEERDPVRRAVVEVALPEGVPLRWSLRACGRGTEPLVLRAEGKVLHRWETRNLALLEAGAGAPPRLLFSAGHDWNALAAWLRRRMDEATPRRDALVRLGPDDAAAVPWLAQLHPDGDEGGIAREDSFGWCLGEAARLRREGQDVELLLVCGDPSRHDDGVPDLAGFDGCLLRSRDGRRHWVPGCATQGRGLPGEVKGRPAWAPETAPRGGTCLLPAAEGKTDRVELDVTGRLEATGALELSVRCRVRGLFVEAVARERLDGDDALVRESADRLGARCPEGILEGLTWTEEGDELVARARIRVAPLAGEPGAGPALLAMEACRFLPAPLPRIDGMVRGGRGSVELRRRIRVSLPASHRVSEPFEAGRDLPFADFHHLRRPTTDGLEIIESWTVAGRARSAPMELLRRGFLSGLAEEVAQPLLLPHREEKRRLKASAGV